MSLREMASMCYVSQASLSRFCRFVGFASFAEFKDALDSANYRLSDDYSRELSGALATGGTDALGLYRAKLHALVDATLAGPDVEEVVRLIQAMREAKRIVFFSHHFLWHIGRHLQGKLLLLGTFMELPQSYEHQLEAAESLQEGDLAIVCSMNGSYFSHYYDIVRNIFSGGAKVAALTSNRNALYLSRADFVLTCGSTNEDDLGKHAALMTMDYLVVQLQRQ